MIYDLLFQILLYAVQVAVLAGLGSLCNYVIKKTGHARFQAAVQHVDRWVRAAEQTIGPGKGAEKKQEVIKWLTKAFGKKLSEEQMSQLIEAAVYEMNLVIKEKTANEALSEDTAEA